MPKPLYQYDISEVNSIPANEEYKFIGMFLGEIIWAFRASLGDFSVYKGSLVLPSVENYIFWLIFILIFFSAAIVMLNFIVAEAS